MLLRITHMVLLAAVWLFTSAVADVQSPLCSQDCLYPVLVALPCYSNTSTPQQLANCFCPNIQAQAAVATCVRSQCNNTELDISGKIGQAWCAGQPVESRSQELIITVILCAVFVAIFILLRAWSRFITGFKFGWDDWTLGIATFAIFAFLAIQIPNAYKGTGLHVWNVDPAESEDLLKIFWTLKLTYIVAQVFTKLSLVIFYLRIFPYRWVRILAWIMFAWLITHGIVFFFLELFECSPVEAFWNLNIPGECRDENAVYYIGAATSIFEDLYILALPIPCISALSMGVGKKFVICFVFALGSLATVTSMVRLKVLRSVSSSTDTTWSGLDLAIWSSAEVSSAAVCGCLPALRPLLSRFLPRFFGNEKSSSRSFRFKLRHITNQDPEAIPEKSAKTSKFSSSSKPKSKTTTTQLSSSDSMECIHSLNGLQLQQQQSHSLGNEEDHEIGRIPSLEQGRDTFTGLCTLPTLSGPKSIEVVTTTEVKIQTISSQNKSEHRRSDSRGIQIVHGYVDSQKMQHEADPYKWEASYKEHQPNGSSAKQ